MRVTLRNLTKRFGTTTALANVSLEIQEQELFFLLGPSGCGKTTLLRLVAGFAQPDEGELYFGERSMRGIPPHERNTGMVFQNYALWPHMSVAENVSYGLDVRGVRAQEKRERVAEALEIVQMQDYQKRMPNQLSGGQQQRVALARALVIRPDVLLLDEPLSNLDARLRLEMRDEIRRIHGQTRITTLYVTHDQKEALSLANRMAVMRSGRVEQIGEPRAVYRAPSNRFVADFLGETNWLAAEIHSAGADGCVLQTECGPIHTGPADGLRAGTPAWVGFRPEAIQIGANRQNTFDTTVTAVSYFGEVERYTLEVRPGIHLTAFEQNPAEIRRLGAKLTVHVRPQDCLVLRSDADF